MKTVDEVKEYLCEHGYEGTIVFENPGYADECAVYDFEKMVVSLQEEDGMEEMDAIEFIEYNTIRAIPYIGHGAPVVFYPVME